MLHAQVPLEQLYQGGALSFEFRRTYSRLTEMLGSSELAPGVIQ